MRKSVLITLFVLLCGSVYANQFSDYINQGKWANAKLWLNTHRSTLPSVYYYCSQVQLCHLLNEQEISKVYSDSLRAIPGFGESDYAMGYYYLSQSRYFQYHKLPQATLKLARQAFSCAQRTTDVLLTTLCCLQVANALRLYKNMDDSLYRERLVYTNKGLEMLAFISDEFYFYQAKLLQVASLCSYEELANPKERKLFISRIEASSRMIKRHHQMHPQIMHNEMLIGFAWSFINTDSALVHYKNADHILSSINDVNRGILIYLSSTLFYLTEKAYEEKFRQTNNYDYLNRAIVWARQNLLLDYYKLQYEGFYFYRRYIDRNNPPVEQRIANLYYKLYTHSGNNNYLSFALKYAEYMRHKPIMQVGVEHALYGSLPLMTEIENGLHVREKNNPDYTIDLITQPEHVARFVKPEEALIAYFCYNTANNDSVLFVAQCIEQNRQQNINLVMSKQHLGDLSANLFQAVESGNAQMYKDDAIKGYNLLLKPVLNKLSPAVKKLLIIPPAYFSKPILFEGFIADSAGSDYHDFHYVFDDYNISYVTSFTHFVVHKNKNIKVNRVNIWNPDYTHTRLAEITEAPLINASINKYFSTHVLDYASKQQLAEALFEAPILHVSAHASASFDNMQRPRIFTALDNSDSLLFDIDLEQLKGNNALAIFAACKSSAGMIQHNGMIDGFTRATLSAGGAGTVCALQNVEESVTTQLLALFYRNLAEGQTPSDALYHAKKEIKKQYSNPKVWQAFIYTGADQTFVSEKTTDTNSYL